MAPISLLVSARRARASTSLVSRMAEEQAADEERSASAAGEAPPLIGRGVADMTAVGALGDDDDD